MREGAEATVVIAAFAGDVDGDAPTGSDANDDALPTSAALTRIIAKRGAEFELIEIVATTDSHQHLDGIGIELDEGAHASVRQYFLGGKKVVAGIATDLRGDNSRIDLSGRYYVCGQEELDVNQVAHARGLNTYEEMLTSGFLGDQARKTLRMTIDLIHGSSGSKGNEAETVMGFGPDVVNRTLPVILCDEDDVQGNHGATIGGISQDQVSYLAVRGLSEKQVDELLVRALFDDAAINAVTPAARTAVLERAAQVLGDEVANDITEGLGLETEKG